MTKFKDFIRGFLLILMFFIVMFTAPLINHSSKAAVICIVSGICLVLLTYGDDWKKYWRI